MKRRAAAASRAASACRCHPLNVNLLLTLRPSRSGSICIGVFGPLAVEL